MKCDRGDGVVMRILALVLLCLALGACASGAKPAQMVSAAPAGQQIADTSPLKNSIKVGGVTGGSKTSPLWKSEVSNEDFAEALRQSLAARTMLASENARFALYAELIELDQPFAGFDMEVESTVKYRLTSHDGAKTFFETTINSAFTAKFSSEFLGVKRLQVANEGAIRESIGQFMQELIAAADKDPAFKLDAKAISQLRRLLPAA